MGRMIDVDALFDYFENDAIDEITISIIEYFVSKKGTVEAIPKADYETRLKADLKAILVELQLEIEETPNPISTRITGCSKDGWFLGMAQAKGIIQHKINALRGGEDGNDD